MALEKIKGNIAVNDLELNEVFPLQFQGEIANNHWTPLSVAKIASSWLSEFAMDICDLGCGVGKFCLVGAASTDSKYHGIDYRASLVNVAREVSQKYFLGDKVTFYHSDFYDFDLSDFDGFYFYNAYLEHMIESLSLTTEIESDIHRVRTYSNYLRNYFTYVEKKVSIVTYDNVFSIIPESSFELKKRKGTLCLYQNF